MWGYSELKKISQVWFGADLCFHQGVGPFFMGGIVPVALQSLGGEILPGEMIHSC